MTTPRKLYRPGWKRPLSEAEHQQRRKGGLALTAKTNMVELGKRGGRPTWQEELAGWQRREMASRPGRNPGGGDKQED